MTPWIFLGIWINFKEVGGKLVLESAEASIVAIVIMAVLTAFIGGGWVRR
jgi:energy-converting hydrogenase Eha subunit A